MPHQLSTKQWKLSPRLLDPHTQATEEIYRTQFQINEILKYQIKNKIRWQKRRAKDKKLKRKKEITLGHYYNPQWFYFLCYNNFNS